MKVKIIFSLALSFLSLSTFAQGKLITEAGIAINSNDFEQAKTAIDKAEEAIQQKQATAEEVDEKDMRKFLRYKEMIYARIAEKTDSSELKLTYMDKSKQAALKYFETDQTKYYEKEVKDDMAFLSTLYHNTGVEYFNKKEYAKAAALFGEAIELNKFLGKDNFHVYHNAAFSSLYAGNYDKAIAYFDLLIVNKYDEQKSIVVYKRSIVRAYYDQGNKDMALKKLSEFNSGDSINIDFLKEEISILLDMGKTKEALVKMDQLITLGEKDALTYENMGKLYEQAGEKEKALNAYKEALKLDSTKADSYYGIGKIICHDYNIINQEINVLIKENEQLETVHPNKDQDKINANGKMIKVKEEESEKKAEEALVYIEKALAYSPKDSDTLKLLLQIYENLDRKEKAAAIKERLSQLK